MAERDIWIEELPTAEAHHPTLLERAQRALGMTALQLPDWALARIAGPVVRRDGNLLDRQTQASLRLGRLAGVKPTHLSTVAEARAVTEVSAHLLAPSPPPLGSVRDVVLHGGGSALRARVYRPLRVAPPLGALVFFHGGGWVVGSLDSHDVPCRVIADEAGCAVVSIDYRLAPEHPFPAAALDAVAGFRAVAALASELALDPSRLAVGGDSAGGNLAAVVARETRADSIRPAYQLLVYPVTDASMSTRSYDSCGEGFFLERVTMAWFFAHYLPKGCDLTDPRLSPLVADDCEALPPGLLLTAGFDPLRDEGEAYARKLRAAGVAIEHRSYDSLVHGFFNMAGGVVAAREPKDDIVRALRLAIGQDRAR